MTSSEKEEFLKSDYYSLLGKLQPLQKGNWGVMNGQQMVEHMSDSVRIANAKIKKKLLTAPDILERLRSFMLSDRPFKENTKNSEMSDTPDPIRNENMEMAIEELRNEFNDFFKLFETDKQKIITNPFFGDLNYLQWLHLLHKHAVHHLKQFSLI